MEYFNFYKLPSSTTKALGFIYDYISKPTGSKIFNHGPILTKLFGSKITELPGTYFDKWPGSESKELPTNEVPEISGIVVNRLSEPVNNRLEAEKNRRQAEKNRWPAEIYPELDKNHNIIEEICENLRRQRKNVSLLEKVLIDRLQWLNRNKKWFVEQYQQLIGWVHQRFEDSSSGELVPGGEVSDEKAVIPAEFERIKVKCFKQINNEIRQLYESKMEIVYFVNKSKITEMMYDLPLLIHLNTTLDESAARLQYTHLSCIQKPNQWIGFEEICSLGREHGAWGSFLFNNSFTPCFPRNGGDSASNHASSSSWHSGADNPYDRYVKGIRMPFHATPLKKVGLVCWYIPAHKCGEILPVTGLRSNSTNTQNGDGLCWLQRWMKVPMIMNDNPHMSGWVSRIPSFKRTGDLIREFSAPPSPSDIAWPIICYQHGWESFLPVATSNPMHGNQFSTLHWIPENQSSAAVYEGLDLRFGKLSTQYGGRHSLQFLLDKFSPVSTKMKFLLVKYSGWRTNLVFTTSTESKSEKCLEDCHQPDLVSNNDHRSAGIVSHEDTSILPSYQKLDTDKRTGDVLCSNKQVPNGSDPVCDGGEPDGVGGNGTDSNHNRGSRDENSGSVGTTKDGSSDDPGRSSGSGSGGDDRDRQPSESFIGRHPVKKKRKRRKKIRNSSESTGCIKTRLRKVRQSCWSHTDEIVSSRFGAKSNRRSHRRPPLASVRMASSRRDDRISGLCVIARQESKTRHADCRWSQLGIKRRSTDGRLGNGGRASSGLGKVSIEGDDDWSGVWKNKDKLFDPGKLPAEVDLSREKCLGKKSQGRLVERKKASMRWKKRKMKSGCIDLCEVSVTSIRNHGEGKDKLPIQCTEENDREMVKANSLRSNRVMQSEMGNEMRSRLMRVDGQPIQFHGRITIFPPAEFGIRIPVKVIRRAPTGEMYSIEVDDDVDTVVIKHSCDTTVLRVPSLDVIGENGEVAIGSLALKRIKFVHITLCYRYVY